MHKARPLRGTLGYATLDLRYLSGLKAYCCCGSDDSVSVSESVACGAKLFHNKTKQKEKEKDSSDRTDLLYSYYALKVGFGIG